MQIVIITEHQKITVTEGYVIFEGPEGISAEPIIEVVHPTNRARGPKGPLDIEKGSFGEKLKALRASRGVTQKELGDAIGLSVRAVSYYETGEKRNAVPAVSVLNKIMAFFGVPISYFDAEDVADE